MLYGHDLQPVGHGQSRIPVKKLGFKPTYRQSIEAANRADRFYAGMAGVEPQNQTILAPPRHHTRNPPMDGVDIDAAHKRRDLEGPVVKAIGELLAAHPLVLFAVRQNSGAASYEAKSGHYAPVHFYRILTHGKEITITDFWGILRHEDWILPPSRLLAIEAKAPGWTKPRTEREFKQANFLALVRNAGGRAGFATSADEAKAIIEG